MKAKMTSAILIPFLLLMLTGVANASSSSWADGFYTCKIFYAGMAGPAGYATLIDDAGNFDQSTSFLIDSGCKKEVLTVLLLAISLNKKVIVQIANGTPPKLLAAFILQ